MRFARLAAIVACLSAVGCLPRERLNASCRWTADEGVLPPPGDRARRSHLIEDVRVAQAVGIRTADSIRHGAPPSAAYAAQVGACTAASIAEIMRRHGVSRAEIIAVTDARESWVDLLAVFLPMAVLFAVFSRYAVRRVNAAYDAEDRWIVVAILVALTPVAAGLALVATQMWGATVETFRIHDGHLSYRYSRLPANRHAWMLWTIDMGVFAAVAAGVFLRTVRGASPSRRATR